MSTNCMLLKYVYLSLHWIDLHIKWLLTTALPLYAEQGNAQVIVLCSEFTVAMNSLIICGFTILLIRAVHSIQEASYSVVHDKMYTLDSKSYRAINVPLISQCIMHCLGDKNRCLSALFSDDGMCKLFDFLSFAVVDAPGQMIIRRGEKW